MDTISLLNVNLLIILAWWYIVHLCTKTSKICQIKHKNINWKRIRRIIPNSTKRKILQNLKLRYHSFEQWVTKTSTIFFRPRTSDKRPISLTLTPHRRAGYEVYFKAEVETDKDTFKLASFKIRQVITHILQWTLITTTTRATECKASREKTERNFNYVLMGLNNSSFPTNALTYGNAPQESNIFRHLE